MHCLRMNVRLASQKRSFRELALGTKSPILGFAGRDLFDREANVFASRVLFQFDTFREMAEPRRMRIANLPRI
jgi:hypothetical protein